MDEVTDSVQAKNYAESRTGRGDAWFEKIQKLNDQVDKLKKAAEFFDNYADLVENGFRVVPLDEIRSMVREDIMIFCHERARQARDAAKNKKRQATELESAGVT